MRLDDDTRVASVVCIEKTQDNEDEMDEEEQVDYG
jgi:hypothetical protein